MIKRLFVFVLLITLLSSCNGRAATQLAMPTFTATQASTETQAQTETQAPAQNTETPIST